MISLTVYYHPAFVAPFLIVIGFVVVAGESCLRRGCDFAGREIWQPRE